MELVTNNPAIKQYENLMYKIAGSFGFSDFESRDLLRQVVFDANKNSIEAVNRFALKVLLSKAMVRKCIFRISSGLLSHNAGTQKRQRILGYQSAYENPSSLSYMDLPLSIRVVYILNIGIGFNTLEVAEILNITSVEVRERSCRARCLINKINRVPVAF